MVVLAENLKVRWGVIAALEARLDVVNSLTLSEAGKSGVVPDLLT
jgi:hypothetical protein